MKDAGFPAKDIKRAQQEAAEKVAEEHRERDRITEENDRQRKFRNDASFSDEDKGWLGRARAGRR